MQKLMVPTGGPILTFFFFFFKPGVGTNVVLLKEVLKDFF